MRETRLFRVRQFGTINGGDCGTLTYAMGRKRLNHLESSILSLLETRNEPQQSESLSSSSERNASEPPTKVQAGGQKISVDTRSTHWDAILNEVFSSSCPHPGLLLNIDNADWRDEGCME